jgi:hypothetical protein
MTTLEEKHRGILLVIYFLLHFWTAFVAYSAHGVGSAILAFFIPVLPDIYWGYKTITEFGFNLYSSALIVYAIVFVFMMLKSTKDG